MTHCESYLNTDNMVQTSGDKSRRSFLFECSLHICKTLFHYFKIAVLLVRSEGNVLGCSGVRGKVRGEWLLNCNILQLRFFFFLAGSFWMSSNDYCISSFPLDPRALYNIRSRERPEIK